MIARRVVVWSMEDRAKLLRTVARVLDATGRSSGALSRWRSAFAAATISLSLHRVAARIALE